MNQIVRMNFHFRTVPEFSFLIQFDILLQFSKASQTTKHTQKIYLMEKQIKITSRSGIFIHSTLPSTEQTPVSKSVAVLDRI